MVEKATSAYNARVEEYRRWKLIRDTFDRIEEEEFNLNPAKDVEEKFKEYLEMIANDRFKVSLDGSLSAELISNDNKLTYDTLSAGTKDTISLAFRLAMLDHLFPDGGGFAVFDDPFTEMSPERTKQACKLLEKFAENNQVIFITCDDKYKQLFPNANVIPMVQN